MTMAAERPSPRTRSASRCFWTNSNLARSGITRVRVAWWPSGHDSVTVCRRRGARPSQRTAFGGGNPGHGSEGDRRKWKDIRVGKGFGRKLLFAVRRAKDRDLAGIVATVDTDRDRDQRRLRELREARTLDRSKSPAFPTALGQANPHGEAWLLDDPVAVRQALNLADTAVIVNVRRTKNPKAELESLKKASNRTEHEILDILADIARKVQHARCVHAKETGFHALVEEVLGELRPIASA